MANCTVSGTFTNPQGSAVSGATVRFNIESPVLDGSGNLLMPKEITTTTATNGTWSLSIVQGVAGNLTLDLTPASNSPVVKYNFSLLIPSTTTATFSSCWVDSANFAGGTTSSPLTFSAIAGTLATAQLPALPSTDIWVGDSTGIAAAVAVSGDVSLSNAGVLTVNTVGGSTAANLHTGELLANTATATNTASAVVRRDASGNFTAGVVTASLTGHASLDLLASNNLSDVSSQQTALNNLVGNVVTSGSILRGSGSNVSMSPLQSGDLPTITLSSDVTGASSGGSITTTVAKIAGTTVSGTTGSGNVVFSTSPTLTNPVVGTQSSTDSSTKAASTAFVTAAISAAVSGINPAVAVQAATTAASDTSGLTYNNGVSGIGSTLTGTANTAFSVDGYTFTAVGQRVLVKNDTQSPSGAYNGVYYVTQIQTAILPPILTRALDYNAPSDINNTGAIPVINGTTNGTTSWVITSTVNTVGTDPLTFTEFTRNPADYLLKTNNLSDVSSTTSAFATIAPTPGTSGNVLTSNGSAWTSSTPSSSPVISAIANINAFYAFS